MNEQTPPPNKIENWRYSVIYVVIGLILAVYVIKLFSYQILNNDTYLAQADENRTREISIQTQRGIIYDRNGYILASNVASYNVTITPALLPSEEGAMEEVFRQLSALIEIPVNNGEINDETVRLFTPCQTDMGITQIVYIARTNAPYSPVRVVCNIDETTAMIIRERTIDLQGVSIEIVPVRNYPTGSLTADVVGFLGPIPAVLAEEYEAQGLVADRDKVGYAGVEAQLQDILSGTNGLRVVEVDAAGAEVRELEPPIEAVPGLNVELTIDTRLQAAAQAALLGEINFWNTWFNETRINNAVVIAMNPQTGEILAMVSYPTYENNRMAREIPAYYYEQLAADPTLPLFNHAISAELPPGSVFKMAAAIGILNEGVVTPTQEIFDPGQITLISRYSENEEGTPQNYVCWLETGHGYLDFIGGVANSCDVYFYKVGGGFGEEVPQGLGIWRIGEYARALGYARLTGIELPGEADGLMPDPTWKRINLGQNWSTGDTYIATIGQSWVLATPLQVLVSFSVLANDGVYMQPTIVHRILDTNGNVVQDFEPQVVWDITTDPVIHVYDLETWEQTGEMRTVEPWVVQLAQDAMREVVNSGTAAEEFAGMEVPSAGKTGTAEYCDDVAQANGRCIPGSWPTHSWYAGYAPYDNPEIAVVAFVYNGGEGASVAAPIVRQVMEAYFALQAIDAGTSTGE